MAKVLKFYVCEICGRRFSDNASAIQCEKKHKIIESVSTPTYSEDDRKNEYPESVLVRFTDNTSARYYRKG